MSKKSHLIQIDIFVERKSIKLEGFVKIYTSCSKVKVMIWNLKSQFHKKEHLDFIGKERQE